MNRRLFLAGAPLMAQQDPGLIRTGTTIVIAPTTVIEKSSKQFVSDLVAGDFTLLDNNKPQKVEVDVSFIPISLVVCIQKSASTEKVLPSIMRVGSLLEGAITGDQGNIAIMAFDHRLELLQDFTNDTQKVKDALTKLRPGSNTSRMNDAMMEAARMLARYDRTNRRRRIVLLIAETQDRGSEVKVRSVLDQLEFSNTIVYAVNMSRWLNKLGERTPVPTPDRLPVAARPLPPGAAATPTTIQQNTGAYFGNYTVLVKELYTATKAIFVSNPQELYAKYTGGREHDFVGIKGLEEAVQRIGEELHSQYLLSYTPSPETRQEGGWHSLQVVVKKPGLDVRTRAGYWSAAKFQ